MGQVCTSACTIQTVVVPMEFKHAPDYNVLWFKDNDEEAVQRWIDYGSDINQRDIDGLTAMHLASMYRRPAMLEMLVQAGAELNPKTVELRNTPLHCAVESNDLECIAILLAAGVVSTQHPNANGHTPLQSAVFRADKAACSLFRYEEQKREFAALQTSGRWQHHMTSPLYSSRIMDGIASFVGHESKVEKEWISRNSYSLPPARITFSQSVVATSNTSSVSSRIAAA